MDVFIATSDGLGRDRGWYRRGRKGESEATNGFPSGVQKGLVSACFELYIRTRVIEKLPLRINDSPVPAAMPSRDSRQLS